MTTIPAVVTILGLNTGTLSSSALFEAQFTSGGVATTIGTPLSQIASTILTSFLNGSSGLPLVGNGSATAPSFQVLNYTGGGTGRTTYAAPFGIVWAGTTAFSSTLAGTTSWPLVGNGTSAAPSFQQINLGSTGVTGVLGVPNGGIGTSSIASSGVVIGAGTAALTSVAATTAGFPLVSSGTTTAPTYTTLAPPGGGTGTTTLALNRVLIGNGTSTIASSNVGTAGLPLVGNGTSAAPGFAVLGVVGGGLGTGTTTPFVLLAGGTTATSQVQSLATTGASGQALISQGATALPIWANAGAGTVTSVSGAGVATGTVTTSGSITVTGATQAQMTAATSTTVVVTPSVTQYHPGVAKAWVNFQGSNGSTISSYNVSSVTRVSTGTYNVNFATSFANGTSYAVIGMAVSSGGPSYLTNSDSSVNGATLARILVVNAAFAAVDSTQVHCVFLGTQ